VLSKSLIQPCLGCCFS